MEPVFPLNEDSVPPPPCSSSYDPYSSNFHLDTEEQASLMRKFEEIVRNSPPLDDLIEPSSSSTINSEINNIQCSTFNNSVQCSTFNNSVQIKSSTGRCSSLAYDEIDCQSGF